MSFLTTLLGGSAGKLIESVGNVADKFHLSGEEKQAFKLEMEGLLQQRDSEVEDTIRTELKAKTRIIEAEMAQGDKFTKRARPSVVYAGLFFIFLNYCIVPAIAAISGDSTITQFPLPTAFWASWGSVVSVWSVGRSAEKRGIRSGLLNAVTGSGTSKLKTLLD